MHLPQSDKTPFFQLPTGTSDSSSAVAMGANSSRCSRAPPAVTPLRLPGISDKDEPSGSRQHPPTYEEATFTPPTSDQATQGTSEIRRPDAESSAESSSSGSSDSDTIEMRKMTPYQKQAFKTQRKAEKAHAKAQRKADKAYRKAEKTEQKLTKRADKLTVKANVAAEKAHTKLMKAADKAHIKAVKKTAKAQKKAEIATAHANAKARAAHATARVASARMGMRTSTPSIATPPIALHPTRDRSHSSPVAEVARPRRATTVSTSTPSRPTPHEADPQRSLSYAGPMTQQSRTTESSQHIPQSTTASAPQIPELVPSSHSEKTQPCRRTQLEDEYAQLELDRIQLDREVVDRQIHDLYAGIGKIQLNSRRNSQ